MTALKITQFGGQVPRVVALACAALAAGLGPLPR